MIDAFAADSLPDLCSSGTACEFNQPRCLTFLGITDNRQFREFSKFVAYKVGCIVLRRYLTIIILHFYMYFLSFA